MQGFISDYITLYNCHYLPLLCKTWVNTKKMYCLSNNKKLKNNEFKKVIIKSRTCYYFDDIKFKSFDFDNTLLNKNYF